MAPSLSLYLNLLRFLAALAVYLFHAQHFAKYRVPVIGNLGSEAVIVFFVLSGLLITFAGTRQPNSGKFLAARLARLWSVCLPALILTMAADLFGQYLSLQSYAPFQPYSAFKWIASIGINALFLNQIWNLNIYPGTNGPFWSLSYEFWYYMIFLGLFYFKGKRRLLWMAVCAAIAGPSILVAMPIWLLGSALYFAITRTVALKPLYGWVLWGGSIVVALACSRFGAHDYLVAAFPAAREHAKWGVNFWPESYLLGLLVAANIYGFAAIGDHLHALLGKGAGLIRAGADTSFGLYLFHYPLMYLTKAVLDTAGMHEGTPFAVTMYVAPFVMSTLLAAQCERRKDLVARAIAGVTAKIVPRKPAAVTETARTGI